MHRDAKIREFDLNFDSFLPKNESLIIQLCEHIFRSGFVFHDSTTNEIEAGEWVIKDFFNQQSEVFFELVTRERLNSFISYLENFDLSSEHLKIKLRQRILKAFDQLSKGKHHHFNIRQNIATGLNKKGNHPLYDLLMYIETYYIQVLVKNFNQHEYDAKNPYLTTKNLTIEDLKKLRNKIQDRLIGRELVKRFLKNIGKERGISYENLIHDKVVKEREYPIITFVKPSNQSVKTKKRESSKKLSKTTEIKDKSDVVELSFKPILANDQNNLLSDRPNLDIGVASLGTDTENRNIEQNTPKNTKEFHKKSETQITSIDNYSVTELGNSVDNERHSIEDDVFKNSIYSAAYDNDVVFGSKEITPTSMKTFVMEYPDSALKYIFRKNLDGRPLLDEIEQIYYKWEKRGLIKGEIKRFVLELMEISEFPDITIHDILKILREKIYEISKNNES